MKRPTARHNPVVMEADPNIKPDGVFTRVVEIMERRQKCIDALEKSLVAYDKNMMLSIVTSWIPLEELEEVTRLITEDGKR